MRWNRLAVGLLFLFCFFPFTYAQTQTPLAIQTQVELYADVILPDVETLQQFSQNFVVDKATYNNLKGNFTARTWLPKKKYAEFDTWNLSYVIVHEDNSKYSVTLATSYNDWKSTWDKYPNYTTYLAIMDTFKTKYPQWCTVETVLANTPGNHKILVAHLGVQNPQVPKPSVLYSSTMHGDEVTGYYLMLRLIDYLLSNANTDAQVQNILNNVDLWIVPLINPDGTYYTSNNTIGTSPTSTRSNRAGDDINRSFPDMTYSLNGGTPPTQTMPPEVIAMMQFINNHHFVMSANFHGGAEIYNYPWDCKTTAQRPHPDRIWFQTIGQTFANSCRSNSGQNGYFWDTSTGVIEGGDWYVIRGSQQDYANYVAHCKEVTIEVSTNKVPQNNKIAAHWTYTKNALLNYIEEALFGFNGTVTDMLTGEPLEAKVFIRNYDRDNTDVSSHLPLGDYYRPINAGTYTVEYSAQGYSSKVISVNVTNGQTTTRNVRLSKSTNISTPQNDKFALAPNPARDKITITVAEELNLAFPIIFKIVDITGKIIETVAVNEAPTVISTEQLYSGNYFLEMIDNQRIVAVKRFVKH
ncbi:MAG: carboxypeptidase regulatory-like domain-containing protein [Bacteroidales bacterium]|jgi:hypothetical protein|nr:carboxypeptidase regulatory-like domain-containing protein [Bacteroidales bacterium]